MKTLLKDKLTAFKELQESLFKEYPKDILIKAVAQLIYEVKRIEGPIDLKSIEVELDEILLKNEVYMVLLTLMELDANIYNNPHLVEQMAHSSYNQHRTIALNICNLYGSGAISLYGFVDCKFRAFFPTHHSGKFLSKGVAALVASVASTVISGVALSDEYLNENIEVLAERGVTVDDMAEIVVDLQKPYNPNLTHEICTEYVLQVLRKEQTYHTIQLCVAIDKGVESGKFGEQFTNTVGKDEGLYGVDESINLSITSMYGMIAITNFGFLDKSKPKIIGDLDSDHEDGKCNTFIDDTVCAIVAATCARIAHNIESVNNKPVYV